MKGPTETATSARTSAHASEGPARPILDGRTWMATHALAQRTGTLTGFAIVEERHPRVRLLAPANRNFYRWRRLPVVA